MLPLAAGIALQVLGLALVVAVLVRSAHLLHRYTYFYQYLFFCRFPLLFALLLLFLPWLMLGPARGFLANLAELDPPGVGLAATLATFTGWIVLFTLTRTLEIAPTKTGLGFLRRRRPRGEVPLRVQALYHLRTVVLREETRAMRRLVYFGALAVPLWLTVAFASSYVDGALSSPLLLLNLTSAVAGVGLAFFLRWFLYGRAQEQQDWSEMPVAKPFLGVSRFILRRFFRIDLKAAGRHLIVKNAQAFLFASTAALVYLVVGVLSMPALGVDVVPSLAFILLLAWLYCFLLSLLAVALDSYRVPVLTVFVLGVGALYAALETDYAYELIPAGASAVVSASAPSGPFPDAAPGGQGAASFTAAEALSAWRRTRGAGADAVVVVAASGGGITAAQWTAEVLTRLHEDLHPAFGEALVLLSTTSGGSVGAMYYMDRFPALLRDEAAIHEGPTPYDRIRAEASRSSLAATVHGLVYGDVWRAIPGLHLALPDRGNTLEDVWEHRLAHPDATVRTWGAEARAGQRPAHVFNATIAETGELFLISPLFHEPPFRHLDGLYPDHDVAVATAARLSATFPFVSPIARPSRRQVRPERAYHLADGGYFDNQGLIAAVQFIAGAYAETAGSDTATVTPEMVPPEKIVLIRIRAFEGDPEEAAPEDGWKYTFLGPLLTVMNMRTAAQQARGTMEEDLLRRVLGARGTTVNTVSFTLRRADVPLSWHLTEANKASIRCAWNAQQDAFDQVGKALLGEAYGRRLFRPVADCPAR